MVKEKMEPEIEQPEMVQEEKIVICNGEFQFPDGATYVGEYVKLDGVKIRQGKGTYKDGDEKYTGEWENDCMQGNGTYAFATGDVYEGGFSKNAFDGMGRYTWKNGAVYDGEWRWNKMHGTDGCYTDAMGVEWKGEFCNGKYFTGNTYLSLR